MSNIEKREIIEQRRKIFESGTQRADKRTGSFNFLTWAFFIAPLIVSKDLLAAGGKPTATSEDHAEAPHKGAVLHTTNEDAPVMDLAQTAGEKETSNGTPALSAAHPPQVGFAPQPHEDQPSIAHSDAIATASGGADVGGPEGVNDANWGDLNSVDDNATSQLSVHPHLGSGQPPSESAVESFQSNVIPSSVSASAVSLGGPSNDLTGAIAFVEAAGQPAIVTLVSGINGGNMNQDLGGTLAPLEAATQPLVTKLSDSVDALTKDVTHVAPLEAITQPVLSTLSDSVDALTKDVTHAAPLEAITQPVLSTLSDSVDALTKDVTHAAPLEAITQPALTTLSDSVDALTKDVTHAAPLEAITQPALTTLSDSVDALTKDVTHAAPLEAITQPVLSTLSDSVDALTKDVTHAAPIEAITQPVLSTLSDSVDALTKDVTHAAPIEAITQPVLSTLSDSVDALTKDVTHVAPVEAITQPVLSTLSDSVDTLTKDVTHVAPVESITQPLLTTLSESADTPTQDGVHATPVDAAPHPMLTTLGDTADTAKDVVAQATDTSNPVTTPVATQGDLSSDAPHQADTLLALATAPDAPIQVPDSSAATPANTATPTHLTNLGADVIDLNDASPPANTLFTGTQYTEYGIALSSDPTVSPPHTDSPADATSTQPASATAVVDVQQHPDIVDPAHSTDHLAHAIL